MVLGVWDWRGSPFYPFPSNSLWASTDDDNRLHSMAPPRVDTQSDGGNLARIAWVRGCQIHDGIIQGLHLDQKPFQVLQGNPSYMGFQFGQGFGIRGKRKATHGHFNFGIV